MKVSRENVDKSKNETEPKQLGGKGGVRAAAIDTCNLRIAIDEPIQMWIQSGWIEYGRGAEKTEVMKELIQRIGDEGRSRESCFAERDSGVGVRLNNKGNNRKQRRVSSKSKGNGTRLRDKRQLDANFKEGTINIVEQHKANKGTEGLTGSGKRPIGDQIEFGLGRAIAIRSDVVADILNPVGEEFTFLQLESDTVLHKDRTYTFKIRQKSVKRRRPEENIVSDSPAAFMSCINGSAFFEKAVILTAKDEHHASVKSRSVARPERHHSESILFPIRSEESQFALISIADADLMVASFVVKTDKI